MLTIREKIGESQVHSCKEYSTASSIQLEGGSEHLFTVQSEQKADVWGTGDGVEIELN